MNYVLVILLNCFSWKIEIQIQGPKRYFEIASFKKQNLFYII